MGEAEARAWAERALGLTDRKKLEATGFVGAHAERVRTGPDNVWETCEGTNEQADSQYRATRSRNRGDQIDGDG